jgi:hypothetical protein
MIAKGAAVFNLATNFTNYATGVQNPGRASLLPSRYRFWF